ncbi:MAG: hypothetical protein MPK62_01375 [Alphaproteobacteria bacterium]|nr:hypothetical protein [Alphaproteobacteria bacterium]MDA8029786.1 hypothetical protein [Alphaproteobacteria bacterium]
MVGTDRMARHKPKGHSKEIAGVAYMDVKLDGHPKSMLEPGTQMAIADTVASVTPRAKLVLFYKEKGQPAARIYSKSRLPGNIIDQLWGHSLFHIRDLDGGPETTFKGVLVSSTFHVGYNWVQ